MHARLLTLAALVVVAVTVAAAPSDKRERLAKLRDRIETIKQRMAEDRQSRDDNTAALAEIEQRIAEIAERVDKLDHGIAQAETRVDELAERADQQRSRLDARLKQLGGQMRAAYRVGRQGRLQMLLSQDNPAEVGRLLAYYEYYADAQSQAIADVRSRLADLRDTRAQLADKRARLADKRAERRSVLANLESSRDKRESTIDAIASRLTRRGDKLDELQADAQRLQGLIDSFHKTVEPPPTQAPDTPFAQRKGSLPPPVDGRVIADFGDDKAGGRLTWDGVWLAAASGTAVQAAAPGRVVYVGWMHRYGLIVVLDHGNNYYTVYGHNQSVGVQVGDRVSAGDRLAAAGNSGGHDTTGVYFEIRRGRTPVNPAQWLGS